MKILLLIFLTSAAIFASAQSSITWNMGMNIASSGSGNMHPRIVTDGSGNPLVIWNHASRAMFSKWNGTAFTAPIMLNPGAMMVAGATWMGPDIASKGDTVYVVFKVTPEADTSSHIFIMHSFDGGNNFSMPSQVDQIADSISRFPTVAIDDSGNPIVAFMKFDPMFMDSRWVITRSGDFGSTFNVDTKASGWSGGVICDCCPGAVTNNGNNVLMVYRDNFNNLRDQWAGKSTDNGNSFTSGMPIDQNNWNISSCPATGPDAVIIGDTVYTVYMSAATGDAHVYYSAASVSSMSGTTGSEITGNFAGLSMQNYPRIATDGTAMALAWTQSVNGVDQCALLFTNNIANGFPASYDTVDFDEVVNTDVAIAGGNIFVVWEDDASGTVKFRSGTFNSTTETGDLNATKLFSVSPNPASGKFTIYTNKSVTTDDISATDYLGQKISLHILSSDDRHIVVSTENMDDGIYFITVRSAGTVSTRKTIIRKN